MDVIGLNRRKFLVAGAGSAIHMQAQASKKRIAAIITIYTQDHGFYSHAAVIVGRLLAGYSPDGVFTPPRTRVVSMYTAQVPANDLSRGLAEKYGFTIYPTIKDAMTLGGDDLAVDAVCCIGEHGNYPYNDRGQHLYPRYELMESIVEVFRCTGKSVPVFSDKHFSYSQSKAKQMYSWSRELKFPVMAGSSIPLTMRSPPLEISYDAEIEHAVALGYGELDAYGFHTLEALQCMVERRKGGETGRSNGSKAMRFGGGGTKRAAGASRYSRRHSLAIGLSSKDVWRITLSSLLPFSSSISTACVPRHTCWKGR